MRHQQRRAELAAALERLEVRLSAACAAAGRDRSEVRLVAVTKGWPATDVGLLRDLGVRDVGESKDQEATAKVEQAPGMRWHFVGRLQRNKARSVASYATVLHSLDRPALVPVLSDGAQRAGRTVQVLLQVSLNGDPSRGGALPVQLPALGEAVASAAGLVLTGLMAVAPPDRTPEQAFAELAALSGRLRAEHPAATALSAGMSADLELAVAAGATLVRIGTALLGHRAARLG